MPVNLLETRRLYVDSGGYKALSESELQLLRDGDIDTVGISVSGETLSVVADLGVRYRLGTLRYYRSSATLENITFFGKQGSESGHPWVELPHTDEGAYLLVDLGEFNDRYEFLRVVHAVTTGTATVYEFEAFAGDEQVLFGEDGLATVYSVDSGTATLFPERVSIYNPTTSAHSFYCLLEGEDSHSQGAAIGLSASGPFYTLHETGINVPSDYSWASGSMESVEESGPNLVLSSGTSGVYYTPVIDVSSLGARRLFWHATLSGTNAIDDSSRDDSVPTVLVRFSNEMPTDGGWVSGQLSTDANWSVSSGTLPWEPYDNYHILHPQYYDYFQVKVEFTSPAEGATPVLHSVGIEEAQAISVNSKEYGDVYIKSLYTEHENGRKTNLMVWFYESSNDEQ